MKEAILKVQDLKKTYGGKVEALKGISTAFYPGEFVVVIGPSGAGKSTFIRCINRMVDPSEGQIIFDATPIETLKGKALRNVRSNIGMVFQHYNLVGATNVLKNVLHGRLGSMNFLQSFFGRFTQEDRYEAVNLLKSVGLENQIYQKASELSGGQMQRVGICRAMIQKPKLLLADEPIASLDPNSADIVMDSLKQLTAEKHLTCIVNLHQVDYAKKYATRIIGIKNGLMVFDGAPSELSDEIIADIYLGKEKQMKLESENRIPSLKVQEAMS